MTKKEKELLLKDLCARLPYGVKVYGNYSYSDGEKIVDDKRVEVLDPSKLDWFINGIEIKPYLRPLSSMTEKEKKYYDVFCTEPYMGINEEMASNFINWLNTNHFDYRGLIPMGLALKAPKNMYK